MLNISRIVKVIFVKEAEAEYRRLVELVKIERAKGIEKSDNQQLLRSIDEKVERLKYASDSGIQIPRKTFARKYVLNYEINNLWKMNLTNYWRLIYTLRGGEVEILCIVLDLIDHIEYNKIFGYRKR